MSIHDMSSLFFFFSTHFWNEWLFSPFLSTIQGKKYVLLLGLSYFNFTSLLTASLHHLSFRIWIAFTLILIFFTIWLGIFTDVVHDSLSYVIYSYGYWLVGLDWESSEKLLFFWSYKNEVLLLLVDRTKYNEDIDCAPLHKWKYYDYFFKDDCNILRFIFTTLLAFDIAMSRLHCFLALGLNLLIRGRFSGLRSC